MIGAAAETGRCRGLRKDGATWDGGARTSGEPPGRWLQSLDMRGLRAVEPGRVEAWKRSKWGWFGSGLVIGRRMAAHDGECKVIRLG